MNVKKYTSTIGLCLLVFLAACQNGFSDQDKKPLPLVKVSPIDGREMVLVPAGEFTMGTNKTDTDNTQAQIGTVKPLYKDQHPERKIFLAAFYIDRYEVTNSQYKEFIDATQFTMLPSHWKEGMYPEELRDHPVTNITWSEAWSYAAWAGKQLPTEAQWEKAARGSEGRLYPWGNAYVKGQANVGIDGARQTAKVGSYPEDKSSYGAYDMAGNVMEWSQDWYRAYPGNGNASARFGTRFKVLRGTGFQKAGHFFLEAYRYAFNRTEVDPDEYFENVGFRCATALLSPP